MKNTLLFIVIILVIAWLHYYKEANMVPPAIAGSGGSPARFAIVGNLLYIAGKENLESFDISNPSQPQLKRITPVGFPIETIYLFKDKLYLGSTHAIHIFSVQDPGNPQKLSTPISPLVLQCCDPVAAKDTVAF